MLPTKETGAVLTVAEQEADFAASVAKLYGTVGGWDIITPAARLVEQGAVVPGTNTPYDVTEKFFDLKIHLHLVKMDDPDYDDTYRDPESRAPLGYMSVSGSVPLYLGRGHTSNKYFADFIKKYYKYEVVEIHEDKSVKMLQKLIADGSITLNRELTEDDISPLDFGEPVIVKDEPAQPTRS